MAKAEIEMHTDRAGGRLRRLQARAVPTPWTLLLAAISAGCLVVLIVTGIFLLFYYNPSNETVVYDGSYSPLQGVEVSRALDSTLGISFEVRAGLLMRQAHHWAALLLPVSLMVHMLSIFFTGRFRRPRRLAWVLLAVLFVLALAGGWSGYALPDDMLSGTGLRVVEGLLLAIPVIGTSLTGLLFGGQFPGEVVERLYWLHVLVVPLSILIVLVLLGLAGRHRDRDSEPRRTEDHAAGRPVTVVAVRAAGLFLMTTGVLFVMGGTLTVAPVWLYGPASPTDVSAGSQPDWYIGFLDGALRLVPPGWEASWLGGTWALALLIPQVVVGVFLLIVVMYPFIEELFTRDRRAYHAPVRPRDAPRRTGIGVAGLVFYATLWAAAGTDVIATHLHVTVETQVYVLRATLLVGPILAYRLTSRICLDLQARDRELLDRGSETGLLRRTSEGGYVGERVPVSADHRRRLAAADPSPSDAVVPLDAGSMSPAGGLSRHEV